MEQSQLHVRIGRMLPPQGDLRLFAGFPSDMQSDLFRQFSDDNSQHALDYMQGEGLTYVLISSDDDAVTYAVGVKRNARSKSDNLPPRWLGNWRKNVADVFSVARIGAYPPSSLWVEAPEASGDLDVMQGAIADLHEIDAFSGVSELFIASNSGASDAALQNLADAVADIVPFADVQIEELGAEAELKSSPSKAGIDEKAKPSEGALQAQTFLKDRAGFSGALDGVWGLSSKASALAFKTNSDQPTDAQSLLENNPSLTPLAARLIATDFDEDTTKPVGVAETAPYYPDDPARIDQLNRKSVAEALVTIIQGVWTGAKRQTGDKSFVIHLHGPWGSGKTSILYFLEDLLKGMKLPAKDAPDTYPRVDGKPWLVVHYNAWRMQDQGPPWWTLIDAVYRKAKTDLDAGDRWRLIKRHFLWRFQHGWLSSVTQLAITMAAILFVAFGPSDGGGVADVMKSVAGVGGAISAAFLLKGDGGLLNSEASKRFRELSEDPIGPLTRRFAGLIADTGRPVAVFIDDLDRCDATYVVDLLTQIQTLFREANVLYVVAGDRNWICSSYEQTYEEFSHKIATPGHSLGHMFLEKIFQISVEVPEITDDQRQAFLGHLLKADEDTAPDDLKAAAKAAEEDLAKVTTEAEVIAKNDAFKGTPAEKAVYAAASLKVLHRPELARERQKHILLNYADHLEPNPRAMKRLLNAYGFRRGYDIQSAERSDQDALIRWTILENRWPVMASYLGGKTVSDDERKALVMLKNDAELIAIYDRIEWDKLAIIKGAEARFADLTPPPKAA